MRQYSRSVLLVIIASAIWTGSAAAAELKFVPNVHIGAWGKTPIVFESCDAGAKDCTYPQLAEYITVIYRYGLAIAGSLAVLMIMIGGFLWLTSAGASDRVSSGKEYIAAAISGLVLAMFSFTLLYIINPQLVKLNPIRINGITSLPPNATPTTNSATENNQRGIRADVVQPNQLEDRLRQQYNSVGAADNTRPAFETVVDQMLGGSRGLRAMYASTIIGCNCQPVILAPTEIQGSDFNVAAYAERQGYSAAQYNMTVVTNSGLTAVIVWPRN